jgi:nucleotide-binding universal stress UspA family protein
MPTFKKILCPVDFDNNSLEALGMAADFARQHSAKLFLFHAAPPIDPLVVSAPIVFAREKEEARKNLEKMADENLKGIDHETVLRVGHPAPEIVAAVTEHGADLVVMATHGRTGISHLVLGSVAEKVVREAPCPVLTVRARGAARAAA